MDILIVMCLGIVVGNKLFPEKLKAINEKLQLICTLILIFSMGRMLGSRENFFNELFTLGTTSFLFFAIPSIIAIALVFVFSEKYMVRKNDRKLFRGSEDRQSSELTEISDVKEVEG